MDRLIISLLGPPRVEVRGEPLAVDTRKALALLAYLAVIGQPQGREALAALLWPDAGDQEARGALRRTLSVLKSGLGGRWLEVDRQRVALDARTMRLDVAEFRRALAGVDHAHDTNEACAACRRRLGRAADLYRGDFMAGFTLRDTPEFDDWMAFEAEGMRRELAGALDRLAALEAAAGRLDAAIVRLRRRLSLDPLSEETHRALMRLYASSGDRGAAVQQYRECVRILESELAVSPLSETDELYRAIVQGRDQPVVTGVRGPPRAIQAAHGGRPLVGRGAELRALIAGYRESGPSGGRLLLIEGEPGIGKTRLLDELAGSVQAAGGTVISGRCHEGEEALSLTPIIEALRPALPRGLDRLGPVQRADLAPLLPEVASGSMSRAEAPDPASARLRLHGTLIELLAAAVGPNSRGHEPAGILILDDLQFADASTLDVLEYLARRLERQAFAVALAYRPGETPAAERAASLAHTTTPRDRALVVRPRPLTRGDVTELARDAGIDGPLLEPAVRRLMAETDGVPLLVVEYLDAVRRGELPGNEPAEWQVPGGVRSLFDARMKSLPDQVRQVLGAAAVLGDEVEPATLRDVSGRSDGELISALDELVARGFLREPTALDGIAYRFEHPSLRRHVEGSLGLARRRLLHRRAAASLRRGWTAQRGAPSTASRIALHLRAAGLDAEAARFHALAGDAARRIYAHDEALDHYRAALALGHAEHGPLEEAIGDLETLRGRYDAALAAYETAAAVSDAEHLPRLEHRLGGLHLRQGAWELAERHLAATLEVADGIDLPTRAAVLADLAFAAHRRGRTDHAMAHADKAVSAAETSGDPLARAHAHNLRAILARAGGELDTARTELERSLALTAVVENRAIRVAALNNAALLEREAGRLDEALSLTEEALRLCVAIGDRHREAALRNNLADLLHLLGRRVEAMEAVRASIEIFAEIGQPGRMEPEIWKLVEW